ncbi:hypothetical protein GNX71_18435 [Variovorax sp. RKNM96]|uniref:hypothetical protein n=1 Tax=Variovorax sp. RKNM96 TaxID=2681552 RepID=UPI00197CC5B0|nr:hypothetical protein [Variovorax sp. RKNM96]QSI31448.1 hypothetical protein GNX71_18435 [Variovorax sp. RKNM96]
MTSNENLSKHYVARMVDGVPRIDPGLGAFTTFGDARDTAYQCAKAEPGEHFTTLESANLVPLVVPVPQVFDGERLFDTAPEGVYSNTVYTETAHRRLVIGTGGYRTVVYLSDDKIRGVRPGVLEGNTFVLLDETIDQALAAFIKRRAAIS